MALHLNKPLTVSFCQRVGTSLPRRSQAEEHDVQEDFSASIPDSSRLFNSSLQGKTRRAIDIDEGEKIDARAFNTLMKAAVARNRPSAKASKIDGPEIH